MGSNRKSNSNFIVQGSILAVASIISRIIGLIYRVPLTAIIGDVGNSYYSCAFEIYSLMLLISSCSLPLAVSKLVSARVAKKDRKNAYRVFKVAILFALVSGTIAALIVYFGAEFITGTLLKTPFSILAVKILAPTLIIVAVLGVIRGFFQGLGTMMPSAFSQVIEQIVNAIVSVVAAYMLYSYGARVGAVLGKKEQYSAAYGAAGGTLGTSLGAVSALLFVTFIFLIYRKVFKRQMRKDARVRTESYRRILKVLLITVIPVLLSTTIYNISSILDQGIFKNVALSQGYSTDDIDVFWGIFTGKYKTLINVPISIASSLAASCVPSLAAAFASKDMRGVKSQINTAIRFIMVVAFPCAVGLGVLASPILQLLFRDSRTMPALMLQVGVISVVFYSLSTLTNGLLQGIDRMRAPIRNAAVALVAHLILLLALMYGFDLNIYAVVYANAFFAFLMCVLNGRALKQYSGYNQEIKKTFVIPAVSSLIMGASVFLSYKGIYLLLIQLLGKKMMANAVGTCLSIVIGVLVYAVVLLLFKGLDEEELRRFPKGYVLVRIAKRFRLL